MKKLFLLIFICITLSCNLYKCEYLILSNKNLTFIYPDVKQEKNVKEFVSACDTEIKDFLNIFFDIKKYSKVVTVIDKNFNFIKNDLLKNSNYNKNITNINLCFQIFFV